MKLIEAGPLREALLGDLASQVKNIREDRGLAPSLGLVQVGSRSEDEAYKRGIRSTAQKIDLGLKEALLEEGAGEEDLISAIQALNKDPEVGGILVFKPLPKGLDEEAIDRAIDPAKDVDAANPTSLYKIFSGDMSGHKPATAKSALRFLKKALPSLEGANVLIINRSLVIGRPLAMMCLAENATVTLAHSKTRDLRAQARAADAVVSGMGQALMLDETYFKEDSIVIDCGLGQAPDGSLAGDLDLDSVKGKVQAASPVPGGVGALTTACLLEACLQYFL